LLEYSAAVTGDGKQLKKTNRKFKKPHYATIVLLHCIFLCINTIFVSFCKKCDLGEPEEFLSECLDQPRPQVIARAMSLLYEIGACKGVASLTPLGHHLAALPVHVRIGKMLLYGAIFGYLEPVVNNYLRL
jgi:hypothetical protein